MKIIRFFTILIAVCLFLTGCSKALDWDKNVEKVEGLGFTVFNSSENEENLNKNTASVNADIKQMGGDFTVELDNAVALNKELNDQYYNCMFIDFKNAEQAKSYYDLYLETRLNDNHYKLNLTKDIVVLTNSEEAIDALGLQFK